MLHFITVELFLFGGKQQKYDRGEWKRLLSSQGDSTGLWGIEYILYNVICWFELFLCSVEIFLLGGCQTVWSRQCK